jgi:hypothetical protein
VVAVALESPAGYGTRLVHLAHRRARCASDVYRDHDTPPVGKFASPLHGPLEHSFRMDYLPGHPPTCPYASNITRCGILGLSDAIKMGSEVLASASAPPPTLRPLCQHRKRRPEGRPFVVFENPGRSGAIPACLRDALVDGGDTHAATYTERDQAVTSVYTIKLVQDLGSQHGAGCPYRMA